jgi:hypothetical protein
MTSQPPPDPYGQQPPDPYGSSTPPPPGAQPQYPTSPGQYPPPGPGYGAPPPPGGTTNTMAIISLVLSLAGLATYISAPVGAVLGHIARRQIRERGEQGEGLAMAGIIIGWVITGLGLLTCCGLIALAVAADSST